ncbi:adenosine deaminase [Celerinatantimonas sp. YJH-8]|uniref:adenosine deaminase n=1 Tax=Celerinatantimonas sp. YJH-8 TaxID=3228714 RepID=UPI0038BFBC0F
MLDRTLPVVDLHRHLDGNVWVETIWELAHQFGIALPVQESSEFVRYVQVQGKENDLLGFLKKLDWMVKVLANLDAVRRVAYENVQDAAESGLDYCELRFSPYYMAMNHQLPLEGVIDAVVDGIQAGCRDYLIQINLIGILSRTFGISACFDELQAILSRAKSFVAVDLAGDEQGYPGELFTEHFRQVREAGLAITIHAGEAAGPESIWQAIRELGATRIGHGVRAIEDPALMDYLQKYQIGIESCPTSNLHTSTVASYAKHPLPHFLDAGILVSLNTDDPGVSAIDIAHEYQIAQQRIGLSPSQLKQLQQNGLAMAFLDPQQKRQLVKAAEDRSR